MTRDLRDSRMHPRSVLLVLALAVWLGGFGSSVARAQGGGPQWTVSAVAVPTNFAPGDASGKDVYEVTVTNTGAAPSNGEPVTITDELPAGLTPLPGMTGEDQLPELASPAFSKDCGADGSGSVSCQYSAVVLPDDRLKISIPVAVAASPSPSCAVPAGAVSCVSNVVRVSGGGGIAAYTQTPTTVSTNPAGFGIAPGGASTVLSSTQAGAHPDVTTSIAFDTVEGGALAGDPKDTSDELPTGFVADFPDTTPCSSAKFLQEECPIASQVGIVSLAFTRTSKISDSGRFIAPVYYLAPGPGDVARLGFAVAANYFFVGDVTVRPGDYGGTVTFHNANEGIVELASVSLTVWGVPADPIHNRLRFLPRTPSAANGHFGAGSDAPRLPFFTSATTCAEAPVQARFSVNSWEQPERFATASMPFGPLVGCDRLGMEPTMIAEPTTSRAYAPTGLDVTVNVPQTYGNPDGVATSALKRAVVALPEGMTVNPSAGSGLAGCTPAEYAEEASQFVPGQGCPVESKLGTVKIHTPVRGEEASGSVFLAQPYDNPFGSLLALYIVARFPDRGVVVKAAGEVSADPITGRLVTTFDGLPPLPFDSFTLSFRQGETSPLVTPPACGQYSVQSQLTDWATLQTLAVATQPFGITSAFDGGPCPADGAPQFAPQVLAGTQDNAAGSFSPLYLRVIRGDGEQEITGFSAQLPAGLSADLTGVPFCPETDVALARTKSGAQEEAQPSCPAASQIGHTLVGAGVGSVLAWAPGKLYLAGPYEGAPFSVVSITVAHVGPFDLGTVVVHLPLQIDPLTAVVHVAAGSADQIPHIIKGIVVHVRDIRVYVDRPSFTLNPTSCAHMGLIAEVVGSGASFANPADDVSAPVADPFQAADCQSLKFNPTFKVSTSAHTSRANGASLHVRLTFPKGLGAEANIRSVKVELPRQLPSRLNTLQQACIASVFDRDPAACPAASRVGYAKASTPILPVPLEGPAYFVSNGGAKWPELILVLQGYGVTIDLHGETFISKGVTSSTFRTVPDQPVSSFELTLPQGPYSALAASGSLCKGKLQMPTSFLAQNGQRFHQNTRIAVSGCRKATARRHRSKSGKHVHGSKRR
ncbi:MAG: hypothetical protein ACTHM1_02820 [Solirubrobacteraceae bacterium]